LCFVSPPELPRKPEPQNLPILALGGGVILCAPYDIVCAPYVIVCGSYICTFPFIWCSLASSNLTWNTPPAFKWNEQTEHYSRVVHLRRASPAMLHQEYVTLQKNYVSHFQVSFFICFHKTKTGTANRWGDY
jgi:hypothetical protein